MSLNFTRVYRSPLEGYTTTTNTATSKIIKKQAEKEEEGEGKRKMVMSMKAKTTSTMFTKMAKLLCLLVCVLQLNRMTSVQVSESSSVIEATVCHYFFNRGAIISAKKCLNCVKKG